MQVTLPGLEVTNVFMRDAASCPWYAKLASVNRSRQHPLTALKSGRIRIGDMGGARRRTSASSHSGRNVLARGNRHQLADALGGRCTARLAGRRHGGSPRFRPRLEQRNLRGLLPQPSIPSSVMNLPRMICLGAWARLRMRAG